MNFHCLSFFVIMITNAAKKLGNYKLIIKNRWGGRLYWIEYGVYET